MATASWTPWSSSPETARDSMLLYLILRSGLLRSMNGEKLRYFFGLTPKLWLSHERPLWRSLPWFRALFSPRDARAIMVWLRYRIELFDGQAG